MADLPRGTVTFLFSDVEGSTRLWERDRVAMHTAVERHLALLREAVSQNRGVLYKTVGDGTQAAFPTAADALRAALAGQLAMLTEPWQDPPGPIRVRMALHAGEAEPRDGDYVAAPLNRLARLLGIAQGGQVLLTEAVEQLVQDDLPASAGLRELGEVRLRDLERSERIFTLAHPDLPGAPSILTDLDQRLRGFPAQLTPFLGREPLVDAVSGLLRAPDVRLVTLTGAGGTGKTRLALRIAEALAADFPHGAVFVDLAPLRDSTLVLSTIAAALGLREGGGRPLEDVVHGYLRERQMLLLLDNFEHLVPAAPLVTGMLAAGPGLKAMITSREPLRLRGEREFPIPPLSLPGDAEMADLAALAANEAIALFVDRAQAVKPDFQLTVETAATIAEICARLDGLPLAIELAASRVKVLSPSALRARLERRLPLLTGGTRDAPERQRTLRDAITWSYDLLSPDDKLLFRRLGIFASGWTLEAAEAVLDVADDLDVLEGLVSLVDKSLVRLDETGRDPRYRMLEVIGEFARDRLADSGQDGMVRDAHAAYYLTMVEAAEPDLFGSNQLRVLDQLEAERANLTTALGWYKERKGTEQGLRLAIALKRFWEHRGPFAEAGLWLATFLERASPACPVQIRVWALTAAGAFAHWQGQPARALVYHEEAFALSTEDADPVGRALALLGLGSVTLDLGDLERAEAYLKQSRALAAETEDRHGVADAGNLLGVVEYARGDLDLAVDHVVGAADTYRTLGDLAAVMDATGDAGFLSALRGDLTGAERLLTESVGLAVEFGAQVRIGWALMGFGHVMAKTGRIAESVRLLASAITAWEIIGEVMRPSVQAEYDRALAEHRRRLGEESFSAAWQQGHSLTLEQAIDEARSAARLVGSGTALSLP